MLRIITPSVSQEMRQLWKSTSFFALILLGIAAGCSDDDVTGSTAGGFRSTNAPWSLSPWTYDHELARIAREEIPGFGGYYLDGQGNLVVLLTDSSHSTRARTFAAQRRVELRLLDARATIIREARWDFATLKTWHDGLVASLRGPGLVFTDIDEVNNRLLVGITDESKRSEIAAVASALGIPSLAVGITITPRTERRGTLREERIAKAAGLQIRNLGPGGECTLGFNAIWSGEAYFISASHCSDSTFGPDVYTQSGMYQPDWDAGRDSIAEEAFDPSLKTDAAYPYRYSDASMYRYRAAVQREHG